MILKLTTLITALLVISNSAYATQGSNPTELAQEFMATILSIGFEKATTKYIGKTESLVTADKQQKIRHQKMIQNLRSFGGIIGYEYISKKKLVLA